jgi:hypothetical protein
MVPSDQRRYKLRQQSDSTVLHVEREDHEGCGCTCDSLEVYADAVTAKAATGSRSAFVTHNIKDFSHPNANNKLPHPDIAACFSRVKSLYFITLGEALRRVQPAQFADLMIEQEWFEEPRRLPRNSQLHQ